MYSVSTGPFTTAVHGYLYNRWMKNELKAQPDIPLPPSRGVCRLRPTALPAHRTGRQQCRQLKGTDTDPVKHDRRNAAGTRADKYFAITEPEPQALKAVITGKYLSLLLVAYPVRLYGRDKIFAIPRFSDINRSRIYDINGCSGIM